MTDAVFAPLMKTLGPLLGFSKSRLLTLAVLICGVAQARTVNLSHLAAHFPGPAKHASYYRRLQRFFQHETLCQERVAQLLVSLLNSTGTRRLALDRTDWKLGRRHINVLVLALVTGRVRVPLFWVQLGRAGTSDTADRIALMRRYLDAFGASSVELLLADREFIGAGWLEFLNESNVPFAIRLREKMTLRIDGKPYSFASLLRKRRRGSWDGCLQGMETGLRFAARRLSSGEALIIATNTSDAGRAMRAYHKRWEIECLFGDLKSRGLNLEDTHITDPAKLETLMGIAAIAIAWVNRCATVTKGRKPIARKTHGRPEKSWFRIGLDALRRWLLFEPHKAAAAWVNPTPDKQ